MSHFANNFMMDFFLHEEKKEKKKQAQARPFIITSIIENQQSFRVS